MRDRVGILFIVLLVIVLIGLVGSMIVTRDRGREDPQTVIENDDVFITVYTDPETGVEYLIYDGYKAGAMSVRYNADGTIRVNQGFSEE